MAFYRMSGSSKGELHGASILVTVDGGTSGETVTLTKDTFSKSGVLSDDGTCLFTDLLEAGTYTAAYQTHSNTVSISASDILNKVTKNLTIATSKTVTLTLEGAKEDTITIKNSGGVTVGTCIFPSGSTTGTVSFEIPSEGGTYTFTSSVAKDTTTGTSDYSKTATITESTTNVKVMPEGALYWCGNECSDKTGGLNVSNSNPMKGWPYSAYPSGASKNTNSLQIQIPATPSYSTGFVSSRKIQNILSYSKICFEIEGDTRTFRAYLSNSNSYAMTTDGTTAKRVEAMLETTTRQIIKYNLSDLRIENMSILDEMYIWIAQGNSYGLFENGILLRGWFE